MTTFNQMVDETLLKLAGYGMRHDSVTALTSSITSSSLTISIDNTESIGRGLIEIDDELIYVESYDRTTGVLTIPAFGRGYAGTTAASHSAGAKVTVNPIFTRHGVKQEINDTILGIGDTLFGVGSTTFTFNGTQSTYSLPADCENILHISYESIGPSKDWRPIRAFRVDLMADTTAFPSGKTVTLLSPVEIGRTVRVTYIKDPSALSAGSDVFATVTGMPQSAKDVVVLGACYRLLSFVDAGRTNFNSAEAINMSTGVPYGQSTNTAKYVYALFQQRLAEEREKLLKKYPVRVRYSN